MKRRMKREKELSLSSLHSHTKKERRIWKNRNEKEELYMYI